MELESGRFARRDDHGTQRRPARTSRAAVRLVAALPRHRQRSDSRLQQARRGHVDPRRRESRLRQHATGPRAAPARRLEDRAWHADRALRHSHGRNLRLVERMELRAARTRYASCARAGRQTPADGKGMSTLLSDDPLWYKDAVIYEAHVRTFFDSTNDGVGDFPGLTAKLEYLQGLGINALWLLPFYPSPLRDDGYDIADYEGVHPSYGTVEDVDRFIEEAHKRDIRVITELVINHTSDQHPWFQRARRAPAGSPERDFYVWSDTDQAYDGTRIIFCDTEKSNWTFDTVANAYYWHRFYSHQPDLNFDNPVVLDEVLKVMKYWLDIGVDGLRLDAVPYLIEREGTNN